MVRCAALLVQPIVVDALCGIAELTVFLPLTLPFGTFDCQDG